MSDYNISALLSRVATAFVPVLLGIVLHEVAHGWVASIRGDKTALMLGRLTLNPLPHIDPTGLLMFVLTALAPGNFIFGWARPVPVNPRNLRKPRRDMMLVSAAGCVANILLAVAFAFCLKLLFTLASPAFLRGTAAQFCRNMFLTGITANIALAWINLLPIPPLDGSRLLEGLLPYPLARGYARMGRYGFLILVVLLLTGAVGFILRPLAEWTFRGIIALAGLT
jgi:Zn-dependent protease